MHSLNGWVGQLYYNVEDKVNVRKNEKEKSPFSILEREITNNKSEKKGTTTIRERESLKARVEGRKGR